jgi:hypothetical protein
VGSPAASGLDATWPRSMSFKGAKPAKKGIGFRDDLLILRLDHDEGISLQLSLFIVYEPATVAAGKVAGLRIYMPQVEALKLETLKLEA